MELLFSQFLGTPIWFWAAFIAVVIGLLVFDLGILHKDGKEIWRMVGGADGIGQAGKFKAGSDAGLILAGANQPGIGPVPQHQAQGIEQDRFARPGLTSQHAQPAREIQVERLDQDNIADGKTGQHVRGLF